MAITARGGQSIDIQGRPLMVRDSRLTTHNFGLGGSSFSAVPKSKFMFYVRFHRAAANSGSAWERGLGFVVKSVDRPKIDFDTEVLNQYNKKRIVQKKVTYHPVTMRLHDTIDNRALRMFDDYFRFYFGDPRNQNDEDWFYDVTLDEFKNPGQWGFTPPHGEPNQTYFFSKIEVFQLYGGLYDQFDLIHPKISSFDPDELDYANGDTSNEVQIQLEYEGIIQRGFGMELNDDLVKEMGFDLSGYYETGDEALVSPGIMKHLSPEWQDKLSDVIGGNKDVSGGINPINRLISTLQNPLNIIQSELSRGMDITFGNIRAADPTGRVITGSSANLPVSAPTSFGSSLLSSTLGRFKFGSNVVDGQLTTNSQTSQSTTTNSGQRSGIVGSITNSALRGLNSLKGG